MARPEDQITPAERGWERGKRISTVVGIVCASGSLGLGWFGFSDPLDGRHTIKVVQLVVLAGWLLIPPIWLWYEHFFIFLSIGKDRRPDFDVFKHGQEQSAKVWLALVTVLFGLYFHKDLGPFTAGPAASPCVSAPQAPPGR